MSDLPPISGKVGLDVTDYKTALSEMNRDIRVIESGFKATAAALGDWGNSVDGLEARIKSLTGEIEIQQKKVAALEGEYKRVRDEKGENSRAAEELEIKLNKERETLGKMETDLRNSEGKLKDLQSSSEKAGEGMDKLEKETGESREALIKFETIANGLGAGLEIGIMAVAGLAAAVVGVSAAITNLVLDAGKASGELVDMSLKTGISTTRLQELAYAGEQIGTSGDTITSSFAKMTRSMDQARKQSQEYEEKLAKATTEEERQKVKLGDMAEAFKELGVSFMDTSGNLRDQEDVFADLITALGKMENKADRDAYALRVFGRSAMELNPLIEAGAEELARLSQEAHDMGAVVSEDTVNALETFDDHLQGLKGGVKGTMMELAGAFVPGFENIIQIASGYQKQFSEIVRGSDGDLVEMAKGIGGLIGEIAKDIATRGPELLQVGLDIIQGILNAIIENLPQLVEAAANIITSLMRFLTENLPSLIKTGLEIVLALVNAIIDNLPALVEAGIEALIALVEGLSEALPELIPKIVEAITLIVETLLDHLPELIEAGGKLLIAIVEGLAEALPILIEKAPDLVEALADALIALLPILAEIGLEMLKVVARAFVDNLPLMGEAAGKLPIIIHEKAKEYFKTLFQVGKYVIESIWEGIKANKDYFMKQVTGFFESMLKAVKDTLGIHSPSKLFAEIGENAGFSYVDSLGEAIQRGSRSLEKIFGETAVSFGAAGRGSLAPAPAPAAQPVVNQFYLTANYPSQAPGSLKADIRLLQMLYGEA